MNQSNWEASIEKVGVVVGCVVKQDGKYLMVKENPHGTIVYNLPAGHVDKGESIESAAVREALEETGYEVKLGGQIGLYHETAAQSVKHVFSAEIIGGSARPQEGEILEVIWMSYEEVNQLHNEGQLRAPWVWDVIQGDHHKSRASL